MAGTLFTIKGRLVQGDPYKGNQRKDDKTGALRTKADGSPMMNFFVAVAVPKNDPAWPAFKAMCDAEAAKAWSPAQYQHRDFANKIEDGDSIEPNKKGKRNVDREGFAGHWIVKLQNGFAPKVQYWGATGWTDSLGQNDVPMPSGGHRNIRAGDFVTVIGDIESNGSAQSPGMYMNVKVVAFEAEGPEIVQEADYTSLLGTRGPSGAAAVPPPHAAGAASPPPPAATPPSSPTAAPGNAPPPPGYAGFMDAPPPPPPVARVMLPAAGGASYEQMIEKGWTDALLVQHGMMAA